LKQQYYQIPAIPPKPFVKWAGGKRQLIVKLQKNLPNEFDTYYEPFLGGGALLFHLLYNHPNLKCHVSDLNSDLILAYITIRDKIDELLDSLQKHSEQYYKNSKSYYYLVRESKPKNQVAKVSRLLFLNRTCFNGLYRVNSKGQFNVPLGRYTRPNIVNKDNLLAVHQILQSKNITITCRDFSNISKVITKRDFVYFDPPYQPQSKTANFTSYTNNDFSYHDFKRLVTLCEELDSKGCKIMLSNSRTRDVLNFFSSSRWNIVEVDANRAINSNSHKRTGHTELLIMNY
jgi:DNA adenine methylase